MDHNIYESLVTAIRAHWTAHGNQYPRKVVLTTRQHQELLAQRRTGRTALGNGGEPETTHFLGAALEIDDRTTGVVVAADGSETPFMAGA